MKKVFMMFVAALLIAGCATSEERAARKAEQQKMVKESVSAQKFKINVNSITPMRGTAHNVTNHYLVIDGDQLHCSLPYVGRDDIPHMKTRGEIRMDSKIEFRGPTENYHLQYLPNKQSGVVTFTAKNGGEELKFTITIDDDGRARIHMEPDKRDYCDYDGYVSAMK